MPLELVESSKNIIELPYIRIVEITANRKLCGMYIL